MDSKKLAKVIKIIVEKELEKRLPKLIDEGVRKVLTEQSSLVNSNSNVETDAFDAANEILERSREAEREEPVRTKQKSYSKNPVLNEILNNTKPFNSKQRTGGQPASFMDKFTQQPENGQPEQLDENFNEMDKTLSFDSNGAAGGIDVMREKMKAKMGYADMPSGNGSSGKPSGLGVKTGVPGLDRVLNRDNSELVKKFKTR